MNLQSRRSPFTLVILFLLLSLAPLAQAQTFGGYAVTLNGDAQVVTGTLRLTEALNSQAGSAFVTEPFALGADTDFSAYFQFRIYDPGGGGADGLTFTVHNTGSAAALGSGGGGLGYSGITPSIAVEADTWNNGAGDSFSANHIGFDLNGSTSSITVQDPGFNLEGGESLHIWVDYDGGMDAGQVYISDTPVKPGSEDIAFNVDLATNLGASAYVGFTGSTGGATAVHDIEAFELSWGQLALLPAPPEPPTPVPVNSRLALLFLAGVILLAGGLGLRWRRVAD